MDDGAIRTQINDLVAEEHRLRGRAAADQGLSADDRERLERLEVELDQCWDLLRRRTAREEFGQDPDAEQPRPVAEVENYLQ